MENTELNKYSIKEATEILKVSKRTLHHYEEKFDLPIQRDSLGNRTYSEEDIELLGDILELKNKGMTLDGIKTLFLEKGIISNSDKKILVVDEKSLEIKSLLMSDIREVISDQIKLEMQDTKDLLMHIVNENSELRQEVVNSRKTIEKMHEKHYQELDAKLTSWREKNEKQPWYKFLSKK